MSTGWIVAAELALVALVGIGFALRELKALRRLREARERDERRGGEG